MRHHHRAAETSDAGERRLWLAVADVCGADGWLSHSEARM